VGETFAGVPYEVGLDAADALAERVDAVADDRPTRPATTSRSPALAALAPPRRRLGGHSDRQRRSISRSNAAASDLVPLGEADREAVADVYDEFVREHVHQRW